MPRARGRKEKTRREGKGTEDDVPVLPLGSGVVSRWAWVRFGRGGGRCLFRSVAGKS